MSDAKSGDGWDGVDMNENDELCIVKYYVVLRSLIKIN